jgi:hypothetical protein
METACKSGRSVKEKREDDRTTEMVTSVISLDARIVATSQATKDE